MDRCCCTSFASSQKCNSAWTQTLLIFPEYLRFTSWLRLGWSWRGFGDVSNFPFLMWHLLTVDWILRFEVRNVSLLVTNYALHDSSDWKTEDWSKWSLASLWPSAIAQRTPPNPPKRSLNLKPKFELALQCLVGFVLERLPRCKNTSSRWCTSTKMSYWKLDNKISSSNWCNFIVNFKKKDIRWQRAN